MTFLEKLYSLIPYHDYETFRDNPKYSKLDIKVVHPNVEKISEEIL